MVFNVAGGGGGCMRVAEGARDGGGTGGEYGRWCDVHGHILTVRVDLKIPVGCP